jgi:hypothetical protein
VSTSEYTELVEFLGKQFTQVGARFDALEARLTRVELVLEQTRADLRVVAEGVVTLDRRLEAFRQEVVQRFERLEAA